MVIYDRLYYLENVIIYHYMKLELSKEQKNSYNEFAKKIGNNVKKQRSKLDLRQEDMDSEPMPFDVRNYQRIEYGERDLTLQTIYALCVKLECQPEELFKGIKIDL